MPLRAGAGTFKRMQELLRGIASFPTYWRQKPPERELDMMTTREFRALVLYIQECTTAMAKLAITFDFRILCSPRVSVCEACGKSNTRHGFSKWLDRYLQGVAEAVIAKTWDAPEEAADPSGGA